MWKKKKKAGEGPQQCHDAAKTKSCQRWSVVGLSHGAGRIIIMMTDKIVNIDVIQLGFELFRCRL